MQTKRTIIITRKYKGTTTKDQYERKTLINVANIVYGQRDATDSFTYLRVSISGSKYNWHITETLEQLDELCNAEKVS